MHTSLCKQMTRQRQQRIRGRGRWWLFKRYDNLWQWIYLLFYLYFPIFLCCSRGFYVHSLTPSSQIQGLQFLYNSTNGLQWNWKNEALRGPIWSFLSLTSPPGAIQSDPCNENNKRWQGIVCSASPTICKTQSCDIISLTLDSYDLNGTIPSQFFLQLTTLTSLRISLSPSLVGSIPNSIQDLTNLQEFNFPKNQLTGTIPYGLSNLLKLIYFSTLSNQITGSIPSFFGSLTKLSYLDLSSNLMTGTLPLNIGCLTKLNLLDISSNYFDGALPSEYNTLVRLNNLMISDNQLSGTISSELCTFSIVSVLDLSLNRFSGSIPSTFGYLSKLNYLYLYSNRLSSSLPIELTTLPNLYYLTLNTNFLTGSIPSDIGFLSSLQSLYLYANQLTGTIPSEVGSLNKLEALYLSTNQLTGSIPKTIGDTLNLRVLYLTSNCLSGTIPSSLALLSLLNSLYLSGNQLSGIIPSELSLLSLNALYLASNYLHGIIPTQLCLLSQLLTLSLSLNYLSGVISSEFRTLSNLEYLSLSTNYLTGIIASSLLSAFHQLTFLALSSNLLSGTIPSEIGYLTSVQELDLSSNSFTGLIPLSISNLTQLRKIFLYRNHFCGEILFALHSFPQLQQLFLHQNHFVGNLYSLFSQNATSPLVNIDLSDNEFSGSVPSQIFLLLHLESISLSLNCFKGKIPTAICSATGVGVISMDGLGSSLDCQNVIKVPFTSVSLVQTIEGSIPDCVWMLDNLTMLNLAGNGLTGTIGSISSMKSLQRLTLAHNYLSGIIPRWLQEKQMNLLDLSHNKISGTLSGYYPRGGLNDLPNHTFIQRILKLSVNRLSGDLPRSFNEYSTLEVLSGNLFSCEYIPGNDDDSEWVVCGSEELDKSMILMGTVVGMLTTGGLIFLLPIVVFIQLLATNNFRYNWFALAKRWVDHFLVDCHRIFKHLNYFSDVQFTKFPALSNYGYFLHKFLKFVCVLSLTVFLLSLPIYILKEMDARAAGYPHYITHSQMYRWLWTTSFVSGIVPSICLLLTIFFSLVVFCLFVNNLGGSTENRVSITRSPDFQRKIIVIVWLVFIVNILVVGTVNGLYLWSTLVDLSSTFRIIIQFFFGLFIFVWRLILRLGLPEDVKESRYGVWLSTCLNLVNVVFIPCVVTALSNPTCYQVLSFHFLTNLSFYRDY